MKKIIILLLVFTCYSCQAQKNSNDVRAIVAVTIKHSKFQKFLHLEIEDRKNLTFIKNKIIHEEFEIDELNIKVKEKFDVLNKNYIEVFEVSINKRSSNVVLFYAIENIEVQADLVRTNGKWEISSMHIIEL